MLRHLLIAAFGAIAFSWATLERASSVDGVDWAFESSAGGWTAEHATLEVSGPARSGTGAGRLTATGASAAQLTSAHWLAPVEAGRGVTASVRLAGNAADFSQVTVALEFLSATHRLVGDEVSPRAALGSGYALVTIPVPVVPAGAAHARMRVRAVPNRTGAALLVDDASIIQAAAERTATATQTATSTSTASPTTTPSTTRDGHRDIDSGGDRDGDGYRAGHRHGARDRYALALSDASLDRYGAEHSNPSCLRNAHQRRLRGRAPPVRVVGTGRGG